MTRHRYTIRPLYEDGHRIDGSYHVFVGSCRVGEVTLWRSGYVEWSFASAQRGYLPSRRTQARIVARLLKGE